MNKLHIFYTVVEGDRWKPWPSDLVPPDLDDSLSVEMQGKYIHSIAGFPEAIITSGNSYLFRWDEINGVTRDERKNGS